MSAGRQYRIHIGLEIHEDADQLIRIEQGTALVKMGDCKDRLDFQKEACTGDKFWCRWERFGIQRKKRSKHMLNSSLSARSLIDLWKGCIGSVGML